MYNRNAAAKKVTAKHTYIFLFIVFIVSMGAILALPVNEEINKRLESSLTDKECTAVEIYTVFESRHAKMFTTFRDDSGNEYQKRTTLGDRVGKKEIFSANNSETSIYRKKFEFMRPMDFGWIIYVFPVIFFIGLFTFPKRIKKMGIGWNDEV